MEMTAENIAKATKYANARPSSNKHGLTLGPDFEEAFKRGPRFLPRLAGGYVKNKDDPEFGFSTREDAIDAARRFRDTCRSCLSAQGDEK